MQERKRWSGGAAVREIFREKVRKTERSFDREVDGGFLWLFSLREN